LAQRNESSVRAKRRGAGRSLYHFLVGISLVVVVLFCAYKFFIRPPEQLPVPAVVDTVTDNPDTTQIDESVALVRKEQFYTFLLAASDDGNGNADTIMVVSYDVHNQKVGVVSIPRDTLVDTTRKTPKINGAYGAGIDQLMDEVSDLVGFPIDYYITVDMAAFKAIVNKVDGIDFNVPINMDYDDPTQDLAIHYEAGMQHLNGQQALEVARFRKNNDGSGYNDSDISRIATQQKMLTIMAKKVLSFSSLTKINSFIDIFVTYVETDLSVGNLGWLGAQALELDTAAGVTFATLPGDGSATYNGVPWCYELYPQECLDIFNALINPYTTELTMDMVNIIQA